MATTADTPAFTTDGRPPATLGEFVDRWIFVFMAGLFFVTVLVGFVPDSVGKVMAMRAGFRPAFPTVLHIHAVLMGLWITLLLVQSILMASGRRALHMHLGVAGLFLAPAMVVVGSSVVPAMYHYNWRLVHTLPPEQLGGPVDAAEKFMSSLVAGQIMAGVLFGVFAGWALLLRKRDAGMHKRLLILATVIPLPAAIDRIAWLPSTYPESTLSPFLYSLLWTTPMLAWDLLRNRRLHPAYVAWLAIYLPAEIVVMNLWWNPWWIATAERLMGVAA